MTKMNNKKKNSRGGFTIVELAVTLAIIVIVSAISIGVVAVNNKTYGETVDMIEATNIAENAVECFRFVVNNGDYEQDAFHEAFLKSLDATRKENIDISCNSHYQDESLISQTDTYTVSDDRIIVLIVIEISVEGENVRNTITVSASSDTDENLLEAKSYTVR